MGGGGSKEEEKKDTTPSLYDEKRRTNVAKELVETERSYVKNLQIVCEVFLKPLKDSAASDNPILTTNEIKDIFGILEVIVNFHATLLSDLDDRMQKWDPSTCMGDIFAKNNAFFKMISTYVNGYNIALMTYHQCKTKSKKATASTATNLDLQSYLIMPVQRIPRYVLLLTELVKYSNHQHPGFNSLSESLEGVKRVADFVNEGKKNAEDSLKMLQIQENLVGKRARTILEPTRKYYGEGTFTWVNSRRKEPRPLQYFLFSDCILLATPEKSFFQSTILGTPGAPDKLKLKILEPLVSVDIQEHSEQESSKKSKFDIKTSHKVFTVYCDPQVDLDEWIEVFYWIRSGCGPRYEKVSAEALKRNFTRADTIEFISTKRLSNKSDPQYDKQIKGSSDDVKPRSPPPPTATTSKATASPPPPSLPAKTTSSPTTPHASSKTPPTSPPSSAKVAPPPTATGKPPSNPPAKNVPQSSPPTAKNAPPPPAPSPNAKGPSPSASSSPSPPTAKNAPTTTSSTKGPPPSAPGKQQGKSPELTASNNTKPPRPSGPPPPRKEGAKPVEGPPPPTTTPNQSHQPIERRSSFTASFSALFGLTTNPPSPTPVPAKASPSPSPSPRPTTPPPPLKK